MQKTISQKSGGISDEKKMENILDRMWSDVWNGTDLLHNSEQSDRSDTERYFRSVSKWDCRKIRL